MATQTVKRRNKPGKRGEPVSAEPEIALDAATTVTARPAFGPVKVIAFHAAVFLIAFLIVYSRRPDAVANAQFYAEDGLIWYSNAYEYGLRTLFMSWAGYVHVVIRSVALLSLLVPFSLAPLVMNLFAIAIQILPVNLFLSSRFSRISLPIRLAAGFLYLALPNSFEIHANITNVQWHLALLACLVLLAQPGNSIGWRIFDGTVLVATSLSSPISMLLLPVAAAVWWVRRHSWQKQAIAFLVPGTVIQAIVVALHWQFRNPAYMDSAGATVLKGGTNGANLDRLVSIVGRQIFLSSLLGVNTQAFLSQSSILAILGAVLGLILLLYALRYGPLELKLLIAYAWMVLALALVRPLAGPSSRPQWEWLCLPGVGNRYYFLPMIASLASFAWIMLSARAPQQLRYLSIGLLLLLPIGIYQDWSYPALHDYHFQQYAEQFERAPSGQKLTIPINPDWSMQLTKR